MNFSCRVEEESRRCGGGERSGRSGGDGEEDCWV